MTKLGLRRGVLLFIGIVTLLEPIAALAASPATMPIAGDVVDQSNYPIMGASVSDGSATVRTDTKGRYQIGEIIGSQFTLTIGKRGYDTRSIAGTALPPQLPRQYTTTWLPELPPSHMTFMPPYQSSKRWSVRTASSKTCVPDAVPPGQTCNNEMSANVRSGFMHSRATVKSPPGISLVTGRASATSQIVFDYTLPKARKGVRIKAFYRVVSQAGSLISVGLSVNATDNCPSGSDDWFVYPGYHTMAVTQAIQCDFPAGRKIRIVADVAAAPSGTHASSSSEASIDAELVGIVIG